LLPKWIGSLRSQLNTAVCQSPIPWVWQMFQEAGARSGIGKLGTHSLRHSYRSWLDAVGTPVAVQQKLMRHADTMFNIYGDMVTNEMAQAHSKVVRLALTKAS
jgi:integrase